MIIIEGPDGAGKTTLKEELLKRYPQMAEGPRGTKDRRKLYTVTVPDTFGAINRSVRAAYLPRSGMDHTSLYVWDRLFFSELVYADITGRPCEFSLGQRIFITKILETIGCPIILCLPPFEVVKENAEVHEQMDGVKENLQVIWGGYQSLYWTMPNQTMIYDYTNDNDEGVSFDELTATIDKYLIERSRRSWSQG